MGIKITARASHFSSAPLAGVFKHIHTPRPARLIASLAVFGGICKSTARGVEIIGWSAAFYDAYIGPMDAVVISGS